MITVPTRDQKSVLDFGSFILNYPVLSNDALSGEDNLDLNLYPWNLSFHINDVSYS